MSNEIESGGWFVLATATWPGSNTEILVQDLPDRAAAEAWLRDNHDAASEREGYDLFYVDGQGREADPDCATDVWYYRRFRGTLYSKRDERPLY